MHKLLISIVLLSFIACSCLRDTAVEPLKFTAYEHNPILTHGPPGSWDEIYLACPFIINHNHILYLFYQGLDQKGKKAIGLAISTDGYHFDKFEGNPVLEPDGQGFDAFGVGQPVVLHADATWVLYFNAMERVGYGAGPYIGRATAQSISGPWIKSDRPVLTAGTLGEWDSEFLKIGSILLLEDHSYIMFYSGGTDWYSQKDLLLGIATSPDGIIWHKYNDTATTQHPFAESDPVLLPGDPGEWDSEGVLAGCVKARTGGFELYYSGFRGMGIEQIISIGYALSPDGIHWEKYSGNPIFIGKDDPYQARKGGFISFENPTLFYSDTLCYMYFDYGIQYSGIGLATAASPVGGLSRGAE
ncbi:MAG: hypothetical protein PHD61_07460 [Bacteroidales bacterium]|nr:hypothetical protein [Lentimicrobiaceae bacterium]MDD5695126.1 hypothetical protein [Bacteroidales bacterium]